MGGVSLVQRAKRVLARIALRGTAVEDWAAYFGNMSTWHKTKAGPAINEHSALTISALFAALNFISGVVASLPLRVYRTREDGGKEHATEHPLYDRLHAKPNNTGMTAWQWIYTSLMHKYLWGNWWTWAESNRGMELTPLLPDRTSIDMRRPMVVTTKNNDGKEFELDRRDVLLIPHASLMGVTGKGVVHYARESLGLMKAQEEYASQFFGVGIKAGGFVQVPAGSPMKEETRIGLQEDFNKKYGQLGESWKAIFITGGAEWKPHEVDAQKAQALESRQFSIAEVSRWTGLSPHLLHDLSRATFSNIEELDLALVMFTLTPIVTQIEQAMNVTFFDDRERAAGYYTKFDLKGLMRGNLQARSQFYKEMLDRGVFNADEVRALEDMNPQPDDLGKVYTLPLNMINKKMAVGNVQLEMKPQRVFEPYQERARPQIAAPGKIVLKRTSALRRRITIAYGKQVEAYAKQILKEESEGIREGIDAWLTTRDAGEFGAWLDKFYAGFRERINTLAAPLLSSYADAIIPVALEEIGSDMDVGLQMQSFGKEYRENFSMRHIGFSRRALKATVQDADDPAAATEELLEDWETERPERIKLHESVRAESAYARAVFGAAGVTKLRLVTYGDNCPYCNALEGLVVGTEEPMLAPGEFWPSGADRPLNVTGMHYHPPLHKGCDCGIEANL